MKLPSDVPMKKIEACCRAWRIREHAANNRLRRDVPDLITALESLVPPATPTEE